MARIQIPDTFFWFLAVCIYFAFYLHFISETVRTRLEKCTRLNHWLREVIHSLATIIVYEMECATQWSQAKAIDSGPEQTTECWDLSWTLNASKESQSCLSVTKGTLLSIFQDDSWSWSPLGCHHCVWQPPLTNEELCVTSGCILSGWIHFYHIWFIRFLL